MRFFPLLVIALLLSCGDGGPSDPSGGGVVVSTSTLPDGSVGTSYAATLAATGGTGSHAWSIESGALPTGLTLSVSGTIAGTPTAAGTSAFAVRATSGTESATRGLTITIQGPAVAIATSALPDGVVGTTYQQTLAAAGGNGTYTWNIATGSLPPGLNLSGTGIINGTPTTAGASTFTVQVSSAGRTATRPLTINVSIAPVSVVTTTLGAATVGAAYNETLTATGGSGTYSWSIDAGALPAGLTLSAAGVITGTPTAAGTSSFTVRAASGAQSATRALTITVQSPSVAITTTSLPDAAVGVAYDQTLAATGGTGTYVWSLAGGTLPAGLTLTTSGVISGTPTDAGTSAFTVRVMSGTQSALLVLTVTVQPPPVLVTTTTLPNAVIGAAYSQTLAASGGTGPYAWTVSGGALPVGLTLSAAGIIAGTPSAVGTSTFTVTVTSGGRSGSRQLSITVQQLPVVITTTSLPGATVGAAYSQGLTATGGTGTYTWSLAGGALPAGLNLSTGGVISGTPTAAGTASFTVQATSSGLSDTQALTITVVPVVVITTTTLPNGAVGIAYSQTLVAVGGAGTYVWSIAGGTLPGGLALSAAGVISGTPTTAGTSNFTVQAASGTLTDTQALTITVVTVEPPVVITTTTLPGGTVGEAYSQQLVATGGTGVFAWSVSSGSLPAGLTISTAGVLSGTPTAEGTSIFTVQATSGSGSDTQDLSLVVVLPPVVITTTTLPDGIVGTAYSQALAATGGTGSYAWTIADGALPAGLTLSATGVISGTPTVPEVATFTVSAVSGSRSDTQDLSLTVVLPPVVITTTTLPNGAVGTPYSQTLAATGGTGSYTWGLESGTLPAGLTLLAAGTISGTPTTAGTSTFTVLATSGALSDTQQLSIIIGNNLPPVVVTTTSLPGGNVGEPYSQALAATGGTGVYTWSQVGGTLPAGLTLSADGVISGTPTSVGSGNFTVRVTSGTLSDNQPLSITVGPPLPEVVITTTSLPDATVGVAYSQALAATGGNGSYTWAIDSGSLPAGLNLSAAGVISGTPTGLGTTNFSVRASSGTRTATRDLSIVVLAPVVITTISLPDGTVGAAYSQALAATGGTGTYTWTVSGGTLPAGLALSVGGVISGTPTAAGTTDFTVQATSGSQSDTQNLALVVQPPPVVITTATLPNGTVDVVYSQVLTATGGNGTYTWSVTSGSLPDGLSLAAGTGVISGTPTAAGTSDFTVQAASGFQTDTQDLSITVDPAPVVITTTTLPNGTVDVVYSQVLAATGGNGTYTWSVTSGSLPDGLSLAAGTGTISGTPTAAGTSNFTVEAASAGQIGTQALSITVDPPPVVITTTTLPYGTVDVAYSQPLAATGGTVPYTWTITGGTLLPAGLALSADGTISGNPTAAGTSNFTVQADSDGQIDTQDLSLTIAPPPVVITTATLPDGRVGDAYSQTLAATGGIGTYNWSVTSGSLPDGLSLAAGTGEISGTPTAAGTSNFTVQAESDGQTDTQDLSIIVAPPAVVITTATLPDGTANETYSEALVATGGTGSYAWTQTSGSLPNGLSLSAAGVISGTPTAEGISTFTVMAESGGQSDTQELSITVAPPLPTLAITTTTLPNGTVGVSYSEALAATGGTGTYAWTLSADSLPTGLALSAEGIISGTPTAFGSATFTVQATSGSQTDTQALSITIDPAPVVITTTSLPDGRALVLYSQTLAATGGTGTYNWTTNAADLPPELTLSAGGVISGAPLLPGTYDFTVQAESGSLSDTQELSITVGLPLLEITTLSLPNAMKDAAYSQALGASGGDGTYSWTRTAGDLPLDLTLSPAGVITGTPTKTGLSSFTVQVTSGDQTAIRAFTLLVMG